MAKKFDKTQIRSYHTLVFILMSKRERIADATVEETVRRIPRIVTIFERAAQPSFRVDTQSGSREAVDPAHLQVQSLVYELASTPPDERAVLRRNVARFAPYSPMGTAIALAALEAPRRRELP